MKILKIIYLPIIAFCLLILFGISYSLYSFFGVKRPIMKVSAQAGVANSNDLYLIAKCIHAEARGETYVGKVAVGAVILNRVASPEFPNTVYGVIYQPWAFTAVHDGQINLEPNSEAYQAAQDALSGWDPTYGCVFYYNPATATSSWIFNREVVVTIGKHVFCR